MLLLYKEIQRQKYTGFGKKRHKNSSAYLCHIMRIHRKTAMAQLLI
jgi:hypothetical protein